MNEKAVAAATHDDQVVAAPWWLDPQVLWFRGTAAERAGIDTTKAVNWDDLLAGAERLGTTLQIDDADGNGLADWVRALIARCGRPDPRGRGTRPGTRARHRRRPGSPQASCSSTRGHIGPGPSPDAWPSSPAPRRLPARERCGRQRSAPRLDVSDMNAVAYPVIEAGSVAPLSGVSLAVPKDSANAALAHEAVACLTSADSQQQMMIGSGHGATSAESTRPRRSRARCPRARSRSGDGAGVNVPATPYWQRVRAGSATHGQPISGVSPSTTPDESQLVIADLVGGGLR